MLSQRTEAGYVHRNMPAQDTWATRQSTSRLPRDRTDGGFRPTVNARPAPHGTAIPAPIIGHVVAHKTEEEAIAAAAKAAEAVAT